ncbi:hypothetical protein LR48_Vigan08g050100 [Vigna angularis]|uniref:Uncharacterized protein n=1 Tax=Phaseolus angularis TaxID=3914 RepID=A0A0L9V4M7_PHAAN|nr:hypothetical protein LR48_Vigan08g050100 [Vigna angularis]
MDPNPRTFPILSDSDHFDLEQPGAPEIVAQARTVLNLIGELPTHEEVDSTRARLAEIEAQLSHELEEIVLQARPAEMEIHEWRAHQAEKEREGRERAETEKRIWKSVLQLDEMHEAYEKLLKDAEKWLVKMYESKEDGDGDVVGDEVNEEVVGILQEAYGKGMERVNLSAHHQQPQLRERTAWGDQKQTTIFVAVEEFRKFGREGEFLKFGQRRARLGLGNVEGAKEKGWSERIWATRALGLVGK